ncbi:MAG TPA: hypothetical protein VNI61_07670, partial [Gemmatimonadales bacterium]|nr:hypothetical protein [Gemmatimonadales bacterium]
RLRAGGEIGLDGEDTFLGTGELLFRFTDDAEPAVPYVGAGLGVAGHDNCGADPDCPGLWVNLVVGFERRFRSTFNWRIEYRGLDALGRHRFSLGLVTRRGG